MQFEEKHSQESHSHDDNEKNKKYSAGSFVYFKESSIELGKPIKLIISTSDNNKHCFYFDLAKIN